MNLSKHTTQKIDDLRKMLNLTDDEEIVFNMLAKGKTITEISIHMRISESTVSRRIRSVKNKISEISKGECDIW